MKLATTTPQAHRRMSRNEAALYPSRTADDREALTRSEILARLTDANSMLQPPASPAPEVSAASAAGLSPQQRLDLVHGVAPDHALRHRSGSGQ